LELFFLENDTHVPKVTLGFSQSQGLDWFAYNQGLFKLSKQELFVGIVGNIRKAVYKGVMFVGS